MIKKICSLILISFFLVFFSYNINHVYAQTTSFPKVENLKGKEQLIKSLDEIKRVRWNMGTINIKADLSDEGLDKVSKYIKKYLVEFESIRNNLEDYKFRYRDSLADLNFSEQIQFIVDSYMLSLRQQQNLVLQLRKNNPDAKKLFESDYLTTAYFYLTLGDQMYSYTTEYISIV